MQTTSTREMYGCDIDLFIAQITSGATYRISGASMIVAGLMSDAQELLALGENEQARKTLNRAKAILFKIMDGELVGTVATA
jgi:hypothetical protein